MKRSIAQIQAVIDRLEYDFSQFEIGDFVQHVARFRGRPIMLGELDFDGGMSGAWIPTPHRDYIGYAKAHPILQKHIILHEIGHMLLDHPRQRISLDLFGMPQPNARLRTAHVNGANDDHEWEAEHFVFLVRENALRADRLAALTSHAPLAAFSQGMFYDA